MTEISVNTKNTEPHIIDPVAFFGALILGPLAVTAATFWILLIPVGALFLGGPAYLAIGTPVLMWHLSRHAPNPSEIAGLAMATVGIIAAGIILGALALGNSQAAHSALYIAVPALIFAPAWGGAFGSLYIWMRNDFYAEPT